MGYITLQLTRPFVKHLLRTWVNNPLRPQGVRLAKERPRLIAKQNGQCAICSGALVNDGKLTHIDHTLTVDYFTEKIFSGEMIFEGAYRALWSDDNIRAVHASCNYKRNRKLPQLQIQGAL